MTPEQGEIVLIPVPFTDLSAQKRRPVIVISSNACNRSSADIVVVAMTSHPASGPYRFQITTADLTRGTLHRPSTVRCDKIFTLAQSIIVKRFGKVSDATVARIRQVLDTVTAP